MASSCNLEKVLLADKSPRPRAEAFWPLSPEMLAGTDEPNERVRGTEVTTSEPAGQEMVYAARISLDRRPDAGGRQAGHLDTGHGGDRGDQDRLAHRAELSALAAHALPAWELAGAVRNSPPPGDE